MPAWLTASTRAASVPSSDSETTCHVRDPPWHEKQFASNSVLPFAATVVFDVYRHAGPRQAAKYELNTARFSMLMLEAVNLAFAAGKLDRAPDERTVYVLIKGIEALGVRALHRGEHAELPAHAPAMARLVIEAFRG